MAARSRGRTRHPEGPDEGVHRLVDHRLAETAGRTIVFSALTVAVALAVLLLFPLYFLRSFAYVGIGVIVIAMVGALVVLPALLTVLGPRVNAGRLPWAKSEPKTEAPFWGRLAALAMRRPGPTALPVVAGLLLLATTLLHVEFGTPDDRVLPTTATSRVVGDALRDDFGSEHAHPDQYRPGRHEQPPGVRGEAVEPAGRGPGRVGGRHVRGRPAGCVGESATRR